MQNQHKMGVLKSYINFQLLDSIVERYESGDGSARNLINSFSEYKQFEPTITLGCISCKETTLTLLAGMIFFVRTKNLPPPEEDKFKWSNHLENLQGIQKSEDVRIWAIRVIRNAIAHWSEDNSGVEFLDSATRFQSRSGSLTLPDTGLHELVMQMYGYSQRM